MGEKEEKDVRRRDRSRSPPTRGRYDSPDHRHHRRQRSPSQSPPRRRYPDDKHDHDVPRSQYQNTNSRRDDKKSPRSSTHRPPPRFHDKKNAPPETEAEHQWGKPGMDTDTHKTEHEEKEPEPEFGLSGLLAAETNTVNGVVMLHNEPSDAKAPSNKYRLYAFKDGQPFGDPFHISHQSRYIFGRERKVADIPTDHPSCSKQHAVIQFRLTEKEGTDGMMHARVRPYLMDLGSTNGSFLNGDRVESERYYELLEKDMLRFGNSSREYVLLKE